jgi:hypothetical protein
MIEQQVAPAGSSLMGARCRQPGIVLVKPDETGGVNVEHVEAAGRARGDSREGPVGLVDRTRCGSEMASGRERSFGKGTGKAWQLANHLVELTSQQSQFLKEQHLAFAPWHFNLLRKAIDLVPAALEVLEFESLRLHSIDRNGPKPFDAACPIVGPRIAKRPEARAVSFRVEDLDRPKNAGLFWPKHEWKRTKYLDEGAQLMFVHRVFLVAAVRCENADLDCLGILEPVDVAQLLVIVSA